MLRKDEDTFEPFAMMISFAFRWGVSPMAWETMVQPVLEKDKGSPKITQLQWIVLLDAGMNMGFWTIFGHQMMKMASKMGVLSNYQFGARSGHMAIGCVLVKCLLYDMARLLCALMCMFNCDAHACYNRMIPSQCLTQGAQIGVHEGPIKLHLRISRRHEVPHQDSIRHIKGIFYNNISTNHLGNDARQHSGRSILGPHVKPVTCMPP